MPLQQNSSKAMIRSYHTIMMMRRILPSTSCCMVTHVGEVASTLHVGVQVYPFEWRIFWHDFILCSSSFAATHNQLQLLLLLCYLHSHTTASSSYVQAKQWNLCQGQDRSPYSLSIYQQQKQQQRQLLQLLTANSGNSSNNIIIITTTNSNMLNHALVVCLALGVFSSNTFRLYSFCIEESVVVNVSEYPLEIHTYRFCYMCG